ncbi:growth differentiation factor 10-like protein [Labeo rohita]|uniref:Growth differentiation factor 10-like protein n=1 Tax=Labeo rohita TaxID=84645 RepID=A0A498N2B0_LABRO|nr:growth/differentiation factor 10b [Labeo rohita]RXN25972.1 growth differentiation factor 10-like protein [Labeo rohita]
MASICALARVFLCLNIFKVYLVNSSELYGDIPATEPSFHNPARDMMTVNMYRVYDKYSKKQQHQQQQNVNTVRSFRGVPEISHHKVVFYFNLTSIPDSEVILRSTLHFLDQQSRQRPWACRRSRGASCRLQHLQSLTTTHLIIKGTSPNAAVPSQLSNITLPPNRKGLWQITDVSSAIKQAHVNGELLVTAEFDFGHHRRQDGLSPHSLPFILVYADDVAITEPNSVAMSLQRYSASPVHEDSRNKAPPASLNSRIRREVDHLQSNYLPDVQYNDLKSREIWDGAFFAKKPKLSSKGQENHEGLRGSRELSFDEKTMKKARRKQWSEPRMCSRRYLRVDFADIGWSEWILAPKAFDAYYCAGTCGFPIPKVVHPSNHATIQSIVRAVGIVPGVPEPCCVPDKMSSLAVLFLDSSRNMVLKVYPSMSVETCACR